MLQFMGLQRVGHDSNWTTVTNVAILKIKQNNECKVLGNIPSTWHMSNEYKFFLFFIVNKCLNDGFRFNSIT